MAKKKEEGKQTDFTNVPKYANGERKVPKVEIIIKRHQQLFELLSNPKRMWRVLLSLFLIIIVLFWGIAFVVIAIKKYYPYNVIETNLQGATTMKTEDKEVIYWLFNTADLWANSGIEVEVGQELTIRASGASFTAIHHLVSASEKNFKPSDEWVGTGGQKEEDPRDKLRAEYRINKNCDKGILLMRIIQPDSANNDASWIKLLSNSEFLRNGHIEVIGKERQNLRISKNGKLHFAVNDIVLTDDILNRMFCQYVDTLANGLKINDNTVKAIKECFMAIPNDTSSVHQLKTYNQSLYIGKDSATVSSTAKKGLALGRYPQNVNKTYYDAYPLVNELVYYKEKRFYNAWYIDNIGSFLIVIERKKQ